jgi:hypothetical protein
VSGLQEVDGERVAQRVAGRPFREPRGSHGGREAALQDVGVDVAAPEQAGRRVGAQAAGREDPALAPVGDPPAGPGSSRRAVGAVAAVQGEDAVEVGAERLEEAHGQEGDPVSSALAVADHDLPSVEVDVADLEAAALSQPQPGPVEEGHHEAGRALQLRQDGPDLARRQDGRHAEGGARPLEGEKPDRGAAEDVPEEERQRAHGLALGGRACARPPDGAFEERLDFGAADVDGVATAAEGHEAPDPREVRALGVATVAAEAEGLARLREEDRDARDGAAGRLARGFGAVHGPHPMRSSGLRTPCPPRLRTWV